MKLYNYFQSSASYRVRIALNLKSLVAETIPVNLLKNEQREPEYLRLNPQGLVPALIDDGHVLTQSLAIIEYLEEKYPARPLLPVSPVERAHVRAVAQALACELAPLGNLRVRKFVQQHYGVSQNEWVGHWSETGLAEIETLLAANPYTGTFCHGASPGLADCVLVPQLFVARRFGCNLSAYPTLTRIDAACTALPAFIAAHPSKQKDAV